MFSKIPADYFFLLLAVYLFYALMTTELSGIQALETGSLIKAGLALLVIALFWLLYRRKLKRK